MPARNNHIHTVYDVLDSQGVFERNPANIYARNEDGSPLFDGPVEFPKMLYHPTGEMKIIREAEEIMTPFGPKRVGEQKEIKYVVVNNRLEEKKFLEKGWHYRPAKAIEAGGGPPAPEEPMDEIARLKMEIAIMKEKLVEEELRNLKLLEEEKAREAFAAKEDLVKKPTSSGSTRHA